MLKEELLTHFDEIAVEQIVYKQWVSTNRSTLEIFCSLVEPFIATQQASFYASCKATLKKGELLVTVDFSENLLCRFARCCPRVSLE